MLVPIFTQRRSRTDPEDSKRAKHPLKGSIGDLEWGPLKGGFKVRRTHQGALFPAIPVEPVRKKRVRRSSQVTLQVPTI